MRPLYWTRIQIPVTQQQQQAPASSEKAQKVGVTFLHASFIMVPYTFLYCGSELEPGLIVSVDVDSEIGSASRFGKERKWFA
jgi:hypothetical protein